MQSYHEYWWEISKNLWSICLWLFAMGGGWESGFKCGKFSDKKLFVYIKGPKNLNVNKQFIGF